VYPSLAQSHKTQGTRGSGRWGITSQEGSFRRNRNEFEGKKKRSPTTRTQAVLIADKMMLDREAAFKPAR
jgi:hypothetical protein